MRYRAYALLAAFIVITSACGATGGANKPPNLTPAASTDYNNTQVIKALDLVRDIAIDGNATKPPTFSTETTRKIVTFHESSLKIINASRTGWQSTVGTSLDELIADKALLPAEVATMQPYVKLVRSLLGLFPGGTR